MTRSDQRQVVSPAKTGFHLDRRNAKLAGVCSGIGRHFGVDTTLVRAAFVLGTLLGFGSAVLLYLAIALIAD